MCAVRLCLLQESCTIHLKSLPTWWLLCIQFSSRLCGGLRQADVHTLSLGAARPQDFDLAYSAAIRLGEVERFNPSLLSAPIARLEEAAISALGNDWWQRWNRGLPDSFGHIDDLKPDGTDTDIAANPFGINFTMAAWLYTISEAWGFVAYAKARYAQYVNNDKAWGAKIADGETAEEIIDSWTWTQGRSIGATEPSDKPALLHVLRHSAVGAEKMLDVLYRVHEVRARVSRPALSCTPTLR